jgi:hypothetical protein
MDDQAPPALSASEPGPEGVARFLDVNTDHDIDHALSEMEQTITRLRPDADSAAQARAVLCNTPADVLRTALRLRAAWIEPAR